MMNFDFVFTWCRFESTFLLPFSVIIVPFSQSGYSVRSSYYTLQLIQEEEKKLRDEHIAFQQQELNREKALQQELLRIENETKRKIARELKGADWLLCLCNLYIEHDRHPSPIDTPSHR